MLKATFEILSMNWRVMRRDTMVETWQRRKIFVGQRHVNWMIQGDHKKCFPAGMNDELEITLVPPEKRAVAQQLVL